MPQGSNSGVTSSGSGSNYGWATGGAQGQVNIATPTPGPTTSGSSSLYFNASKPGYAILAPVYSGMDIYFMDLAGGTWMLTDKPAVTPREMIGLSKLMLLIQQVSNANIQGLNMKWSEIIDGFGIRDFFELVPGGSGYASDRINLVLVEH